MIPPRLSFIVSSDLRSPGLRVMPALLLRSDPVKTFQNWDWFLVGNAGSLQKQMPWFAASDIY